MYSLFRNKKGVAIDDLLPLLFVMGVFVIIFLVFTFTNVSEKSDVKRDITEVKQKIDANQHLLQFLRSPATDDKSMADLIAESSLNDDFKDIKSKSEDYFDKIYGQGNWRIEISIPGSDIEHFGGELSSTKNRDTSKIALAKVQLPSLNQDILNKDAITVTMFLLKTSWY